MSGNPFKPPSSPVGADPKAGRFKKFMLAVLASMIGCSLVLGLLVAVAAVPSLFDSHERTASTSEEVKNTSDLRIVQHARVMDTDRFTVQGVIHNQGNAEWNAATIQVVVKVAGKRMGDCGAMLFDRLPPGARKAFLAECEETNGLDLPEGTAYELRILSATKLRRDATKPS